MRWLRHIRFAGVGGKATRRLTSIVMGGLALALFCGGLVGRQLELAGDGDMTRANMLFIGGIVLALLAIVAAGSMRRPWGLTLGWVVLALTALSTLLLTPMGIVALLFGALWLLALVQGPSMEQMTRDWIAEHGPLHPDDRARQEREISPTERTGEVTSDPTKRTGEVTSDPTERTGEVTSGPTERASTATSNPTERTNREDSN